MIFRMLRSNDIFKKNLLLFFFYFLFLPPLFRSFKKRARHYRSIDLRVSPPWIKRTHRFEDLYLSRTDFRFLRVRDLLNFSKARSPLSRRLSSSRDQRDEKLSVNHVRLLDSENKNSTEIPCRKSRGIIDAIGDGR